MDDLTPIEGQVGDDMGGGNHIELRWIGAWRDGVRCQRHCRRTRPAAMDHDVRQAMAHQFANAWAAIQARDHLVQVDPLTQGSV